MKGNMTFKQRKHKYEDIAVGRIIVLSRTRAIQFKLQKVKQSDKDAYYNQIAMMRLVKSTQSGDWIIKTNIPIPVETFEVFIQEAFKFGKDNNLVME